MSKNMETQTEEGVKNITDEILMQADPLKIDLDDNIFVSVVNKRVETYKDWYKKEKNLYVRQNRNKDFLFGRQIDESELKKYDSRYVDNVIYEGEKSIKPIALSRLPDLLVKPGNETPESKQTAKDITEIINSDLRKRENRKVLALAFKHLPVYFVGIIKYRWDNTKGKFGDYVFEVVHPDNIVFANVASNDPNDMPMVVQYITTTVKEMIMRFPDKKDEIIAKLVEKRVIQEDKKDTEASLATEVKMAEVWFKWYKQTDGGWEEINGVAWKYENLLLKKMKNPNWDWQGEKRVFKFDSDNTKVDATEEDFRNSFFTRDDSFLQEETIYHNHYEQPEFPYILINYDIWGEMPYDETSRIEQVIRLQENINKRGKQISDMSDRTRGKHIWASDAIDADTVEKLDMANPDEDVVVDTDDVRKAHEVFVGEQPTSALFQEQEQNRQKVFAKMGVNSTTRGEVTTDTATTAQIAREADFGQIDDLTEETINFAAEKMANAAMQMIKLRYTEDHFKRILGKNGITTFKKTNRDLIEDGMEVEVYASGVDKVMRKREAYERAKLQLTDPLTFFEDTDAPDPEERTARLWYFFNDQPGYYSKFVLKQENTNDMANGLEEVNNRQLSQEGGALSNTDGGSQEAMLAIAQLQQGTTPQPPAQLTPQYINAIESFISSPDFTALDPAIQQSAKAFAASLVSQGVPNGQGI